MIKSGRILRQLPLDTPQSGAECSGEAKSAKDRFPGKPGSGRRFLVGECFSAADLTFAALAAPLLLPLECRAVQPALDAVPPAIREQVLRMRDTEAGQFALRLFAQERGVVGQAHA